MSVDQATWLGFGLVVFLPACGLLGHYLLCDCPLSLHGRSSRLIPSPINEKAQRHV